MAQQGTQLKAILAAEGRSQRWLAGRIGKHESEVSRIVNRGLLPDAETRLAIAEALCRSAEELGWSGIEVLHQGKKAA
jgi:transcriptional regulator with XRE-family HTH domain